MQTGLGDPAADRYLERLVARLRSDLEDRLLGVWLVNSAARGDYLPGRSDLDVMVGVTERLADPERHDLADVLRHASLPCPAPRLELVVYRAEVLADPGPHPDFELNLNSGPAIEDHVAFDVADEPPHWFVLDLAAAHERSRVIAGPPLDGLLGPIDDSVVLDALRASRAWHARHDADAPNRVLNACRAWRWLETRRWSSKSEAAAWAIEHGADEGLVRLALSRRRGGAGASLPTDRVADLDVLVADRIERRAR